MHERSAGLNLRAQEAPVSKTPRPREPKPRPPTPPTPFARQGRDAKIAALTIAVQGHAEALASAAQALEAVRAQLQQLVEIGGQTAHALDVLFATAHVTAMLLEVHLQRPLDAASIQAMIEEAEALAESDAADGTGASALMRGIGDALRAGRAAKAERRKAEAGAPEAPAAAPEPQGAIPAPGPEPEAAEPPPGPPKLVLLQGEGR
jgi:hypothetical protein